jgi:hypothetical protein
VEKRRAWAVGATPKSQEKTALTQRRPGVRIGGDERVIPTEALHLLVSVSECGECAPVETIFSEQVVLHSFISFSLHSYYSRFSFFVNTFEKIFLADCQALFNLAICFVFISVAFSSLI